MARTKKIAQVESTIEEVKPEPIIICAPSLGSLSQVQGSGYGEFEADEIIIKSAMKNNIIEEPVQEEPIAEVVEENIVEPKMQFKVYANGEFVETVEDESDRLIFYLDENAAELQSWVEELKRPVEDPNELLFLNEGPQKRSYTTYNQYFAQNGYAPRPPRITSWMQFYKKKYDPITEEEIAVQYKGNLKYSFEVFMPEE